MTRDLSYHAVKTAFRPAVLVFRPRVTGRHYVPADGAAIIASNHLSAIDTLFIAVLLRRRVTFLAKSEYFTRPGVRGRLMAALMATCGFIPVDRSSPSEGKAALSTGLRVLAEGEILGVYPEGTRSPDGRLYRGRTGIARLALESGAPILPVALVGTRQAMPPGHRWPRLHAVHVQIGEPLRFSLAGRSPNNQALLRDSTDAVMSSIHRMSGQERADTYAPSGSER